MNIITFNPKIYHNEKHIDFEHFDYCVRFFETIFKKPITFDLKVDDSMLKSDLALHVRNAVHKVILHYFSAVYACRNKEPLDDYSKVVDLQLNGIHFLLSLTQQAYFISKEYRRYCSEVTNAINDKTLPVDEFFDCNDLALLEPYVLATLDTTDKFWFVGRVYERKDLVRFIRLYNDTDRFLICILKTISLYGEAFAKDYLLMHGLEFSHSYFDSDFADSTSEFRWKFINQIQAGQDLIYDDVLSLYNKSISD
ncbi:hypothetical protein CO725_00965 [Vibrio parahaemolyticus]|uniref:hypothetical protein n=1 Tax=Vibrio parahaemolyticus TaxID=670 RepID=UPI000BE3A314|nr:hypothetical protein [Vibrio parahaemolyticus]ATI44257.1 hypothetical protein CO725_00965 [Vibrio parahaemolyticus]